jgi:hypothetical protein
MPSCCGETDPDPNNAKTFVRRIIERLNPASINDTQPIDAHLANGLEGPEQGLFRSFEDPRRDPEARSSSCCNRGFRSRRLPAGRRSRAPPPADAPEPMGFGLVHLHVEWPPSAEKWGAFPPLRSRSHRRRPIEDRSSPVLTTFLRA